MDARYFLRPGDQIRLLRVSEAALRQIVCDSPDWAYAAERTFVRDPVVAIKEIDELGTPWFSVEVHMSDGKLERHSIAITDDDSWERVDGLSTPLLELRTGLETYWIDQPIDKIRQCGLEREALQMLCEQLSNNEPRIRAAACDALYCLNETAAIPRLVPVVDDADPLVAMRAAEALCAFDAPAGQILPRLMQILSQREEELPNGNARIQPACGTRQMPEARYHAARILACLGEEAKPAREELLAAMQSASGMVRSWAARALWGIGEPIESYIAPLREALDDVLVQSSRDRVYVAEALIELGEPVEPLVLKVSELVDDEDWTTASLAMELLRQLGPLAKKAEPALRSAMASAKPGVAQQAEGVLQQILISAPVQDPLIP